MAFVLPDLPYAHNALEPSIDTMTMEIHHGKHHNGYTNNLNKAIEGTSLEGKSIEEIHSVISGHPAGVRNNGGGYYNHSLFWTILSPEGGGNPGGELGDAISGCFGSFGDFKDAFSTKAKTQFGSGWAWLYVADSGKLKVSSTANQDNPMMDDVAENGIPILGLDVWEHAYYLNYQNRRADYIESFFTIINWEEVAKRYNAAK